MNIGIIIVLVLVVPTVAVLAWVEIQSRRHPAPPQAVAPERLEREHKRSG